MNIEKLCLFVNKLWDESILEQLIAYVRIPNKSPMFDREWESNGHMEAAVQLLAAWARKQAIAGITVEIRRLPGKTPLLYVDIPGELPGCVLLYGHLDKQPEFVGWLPGLDPWVPVIRDGKLYGRGAADDGYAIFSSLAAIAALKAQGIPLARCVLLIEASEESGSADLPAHLDAMGDAIEDPSLIVCLDAECGNYTQAMVHNFASRLHVGAPASANLDRRGALRSGHWYCADATPGHVTAPGAPRESRDRRVGA